MTRGSDFSWKVGHPMAKGWPRLKRDWLNPVWSYSSMRQLYPTPFHWVANLFIKITSPWHCCITVNPMWTLQNKTDCTELRRAHIHTGHKKFILQNLPKFAVNCYTVINTAQRSYLIQWICWTPWQQFAIEFSCLKCITRHKSLPNVNKNVWKKVTMIGLIGATRIPYHYLNLNYIGRWTSFVSRQIYKKWRDVLTLVFKSEEKKKKNFLMHFLTYILTTVLN